MKAAEPQKEHRWLEKLIGEWTYEWDMPAEPGKPPAKITGSETVRALGPLWVVGQGGGNSPGGGTDQSMVTLGYDPEKGRFVGTWIGSMMTHLWIYDGALDATGRVLTLNAEGPSMTGDGTMARYQDIIEFKDDDRRTLTARTLGADGSWEEMMSMEYRRKK
jgi:Protein of unknown function (DUF1579)